MKNGQLGHPDLNAVAAGTDEDPPRSGPEQRVRCPLPVASGGLRRRLQPAPHRHGEVRSFGINWQGQLGLGVSGKGNTRPHPLFSPPIAGFDGRRVVEISAGSSTAPPR